jgi:Mn-dependent DtxR family transcriptional regulator
MPNAPTLAGRMTRRELCTEIVRHQTSYGYPATMRELADVMQLSLTTVAYHLRFLQEVGYLTMTPRTSRSIVMTPKGLEAYGL